MKTFDSIFYQIRKNGSFSALYPFAMIVIVLSMVIQLTAAQTKNDAGRRSASSIERKMNALEAMRELQHRQSTLIHEKNSRNTSSAQSQVQIKLNAAKHTSSTIFFYDNMESGANGWTTELIGGATDNLWHQTTLDANSPSHSWWCGIDGQLNYHSGNRLNTAVKSPSIDLSGAIAPVTLLFTENYFTELGWDYCMVDVSVNGGVSWTPLRGNYGSAPSGDSKGWIISTLDLSTYVGNQINIRFHFDTGDTSFNEFPGWFVDDVVLFDQGGRIKGKKFFDVNNNGVKDLEDRGIKNWIITADGPISLSTRTDDHGRYNLPLPLGSYTVTEALQPGWTQTYPDSGHWDITLATADTIVDSVHFGNHTQASLIGGLKFNDVNRNAVYDGGDSILAEWKIVLADTSGMEIDYDRTDSLGQYLLYVFQPGEYVIREEEQPGWVQSYPDTGTYRLTIPDITTTLTNKDFGNYYSDSVNTIIGQKFNDLDRNHIKDEHEPGVPGFAISLTGPKHKIVGTNIDGFYKFLSVPSGEYKIKELPKQGWWQSYPDSYYTIVCYTGQLIDSLDFGNYEIVPGSISGMKFRDANGDGIKDLDEPGLAGWRINLSGTASNTMLTGGDGSYSFTGLWPGNYTVSETPRTGWTQTYPANFAPHTFFLGPEENRTDVDFGNIDSTYLGYYRTFLPESLALAQDKKGKHKPIPAKPDKDEFCLNFVNAEVSPVKKLTVRLAIAPIPGSVTSTQPGTVQLTGDKFNIIELTFDNSLAPTDSVRICGFGKKPALEAVRKWWWTFENDLLSAKDTTADFRVNELRLPMPNAINALQLVGTGLKVGVGGAHSVVHKTYKDVLKSLVERQDRMAIGEARCLDKLSSGRSIRREKRYLTPSNHNNKLFAAAIALNVNIATSDGLITPPGFGDLIFDEGTGGSNPMNNLAIRSIAGALDTYMSAYNETTKTCMTPLPLGSLDAETLYTKIQQINSAFSGTLDTVSFAGGLEFTGVYQLSAVPFLRYDTSSSVQRAYQSRRSLVDIPEQFTLSQNFPNPFNPSTVIQFYLPDESFVTLKIYNTLGQEVVTLLNREQMSDGSQEIEFSTSQYNLASGIYYYRLTAETIGDDENAGGQVNTSVKKMVLVK